MFSRKIIIASLLLATSAIICAKEKIDASIIPSASYLVVDFEGKSSNFEIFPGYPGGRYPVYVNFYTYNGNHITEITYQWPYLFNPTKIETKLDKNSPKPQPTTYALKYWDGNLKGTPGYFIIFYDKNGNAINSYRCKITYYCPDEIRPIYEIDYSNCLGPKKTCDFQTPEDLRKITDFPLDLSIVQK